MEASIFWVKLFLVDLKIKVLMACNCAKLTAKENSKKFKCSVVVVKQLFKMKLYAAVHNNINTAINFMCINEYYLSIPFKIT